MGQLASISQSNSSRERIARTDSIHDLHRHPRDLAPVFTVKEDAPLRTAGAGEQAQFVVVKKRGHLAAPVCRVEVYMELGSQDPAFAQRTMSLMPDDYMVNDFDLNQSSCFEESSSHLQVSLRGRRVAARMVVHQHHSVSGADDCCPEDLTRMRNCLVQRADRHHVMATNAMFRIQQQDREAFHFGIEMHPRRDVLFPIQGGVLRRGACKKCRRPPQTSYSPMIFTSTRFRRIPSNSP